MSRRLLWAAASLAIPVAALARVGAPAPAADAAAVADTRIYLRRLEKLGFAGVVLVARGDVPLFAEGFGLADREHGVRWTPGTISDIGSITKQFTGAAILKLEEGGKLAVSDPITRYFQGVPPDKAGITLHQLLTHSSGLSDPDIDDFDPVPLEEYVRQTFARPLLFAPGKGWSYSNANFSLLGAIVEKLSGATYETFLRERLFLPNGMYETGYRLPAWGESRFAQGYEAEGGRWGTFLERPAAADGPHWALRANGGIHSTVYDMLRWARALLTGRVLSPESMKKLWSPHVSEGGGTFYAYGWSIAKGPGGAKVVTHNGGNGIYFADLAIVPDAGLVAFVMTNVIAENRSANSLLQQLGGRFLAGRAYPSIPEVVPVDAAALKTFAGTYRLPGDAGEYRLTSEGQALFIEAHGAKAFALLNSVRDAEPGRFERLSKLMEGIVAANMKGDFVPLSKAYGGKASPDVLKTHWTELLAEGEKTCGRFQRFEVLGTARTEDRDETVVRLHGEKGFVDLTYVWALEDETLRGRSARGLRVKMRLYPSGERDFFTWDGGVRPPKMVHLEAGAGGEMRLRVAESDPPAVRVAETSAQDAPRAPGRLVDVGGHALHLLCSGRNGPTVVVDGGLGDVSTDWTLVQTGVAAFARVCTYDRAGYAWSEPGPRPRTFAQINAELRRGLAAAGEKGPFVLVGHSYGGPVVRAFAETYPDDVEGMVLVDAVHEDQRVTIMGKAVRIRDGAKGLAIPPPRFETRPDEKAFKSAPAANGPVEAPFDRLPPEAQRAHLWASAQPALDATEASQREWSTEYFARWHEAPQRGLLGKKPLVVLTRRNGGYRDLDIPAAQIEAERLASQKALLLLSAKSRQVILDSGHAMHLEAPDDVVAAIRSVVTDVRAAR